MPDVQVTNGNPFPLTGRFAAKDYVFPAGKSVSVPLAAARHIFGLDEQDKTGALNRVGLLKLGGDKAEALAGLDKVTFVAGRTVFEGPHEPALPPVPDDDEEQPIGESPGAQRSPGGETGEATASPGALTREAAIMRRRRTLPIGG